MILRTVLRSWKQLINALDLSGKSCTTRYATKCRGWPVVRTSKKQRMATFLKDWMSLPVLLVWIPSPLKSMPDEERRGKPNELLRTPRR